MFPQIWLSVLVAAIVMIARTNGETCPSGGQIFAHGIASNQQIAVDIHNKYRLDIANGNVTGQPRGVNLKRLSWDNNIAAEANKVSKTCNMSHVIASDSRFSWVGQNLYSEWSSRLTYNQNWTAAVTSWFDENKYFVYPNSTNKLNAVVGHYTQVVWANTYLVGCDFILYNDTNPKYKAYPYAKLYTCNYAPGGNYQGQAPYLTGTSGCENLC